MAVFYDGAVLGHSGHSLLIHTIRYRILWFSVSCRISDSINSDIHCMFDLRSESITANGFEVDQEYAKNLFCPFSLCLHGVFHLELD